METTRISLIGPSLVIKGRVTAKSQALKVQGRIEGTLDLDDALIVEEAGVVDASLICREAKIAGHLSGNIYATEKASIESSGRVTGAVFAPVFSVSEGARLDGSVEMDSDSGTLEQKFRIAAGEKSSAAESPERKTPAKSLDKAKAPAKESRKDSVPSADKTNSAKTKG